MYKIVNVGRSQRAVLISLGQTCRAFRNGLLEAASSGILVLIVSLYAMSNDATAQEQPGQNPTAQPVYPDIVGGTFGEQRFSTARTPRMETYMMRNAQWASLHSSMSMGEPPWTFSPQTAKVMLEAAQLHGRLQPYLYAMAVRSSEDGYPWPMTPLPT